MSSVPYGTIGEKGGQVAGGALLGAIGTVLAGPVGGWIGRAVGSRVGGMAGRAAAEALASYMEDANTAAEAETKDQAAAKPCVDCGEIDCFNPPPGSDQNKIDEFRKQLKEQQQAINDIPADQLVENMDTYAKIGRAATDAADRATARAKWLDNRTVELVEELGDEAAAKAAAQKEIATMDVIHTPDLSAGGTGRISPDNGGLGSKSVNRSIGSQWSKVGTNSAGDTRLEQLKKHAEKAAEKGEQTNVELNICNDTDTNETDQNSVPDGSPDGQPGMGSGAIPVS
jgi:hypothetical protein